MLPLSVIIEHCCWMLLLSINVEHCKEINNGGAKGSISSSIDGGWQWQAMMVGKHNGEI